VIDALADLSDGVESDKINPVGQLSAERTTTTKVALAHRKETEAPRG
jgi:hypothetical protein